MRLLVSAVGIATAAGLLSAAVPISGSAHPQQDAASKAEQVFTAVCSKCHPVDRIVGSRRTRSQWEETITSMITTRGAQISDDDFDTILNYLAREYGRVDMNRAPTPDMVEVLGLPETMAAAIVSYRREHGRFEDFDALMKVPGIDKEKLEQKRDAVFFS